MKKKSNDKYIDLKKKRVIENYKKNYNKLSYREKQFIQFIEKKEIPIYLSLSQAKRKRLLHKALRKSGLTEIKVLNYLKKEKQNKVKRSMETTSKKGFDLNTGLKPDNNTWNLSLDNKAKFNNDGTISLSKNIFINNVKEKKDKENFKVNHMDKKEKNPDSSTLKAKKIRKLKRTLGRALELEALSNKHKEQSINEQKNFVLASLISKYKNKGVGFIGRMIAVIIGKIVAAIMALVASIISLFWPLIVAIMIVTTIVASIISFFKLEEDMQYKENQALLGSQ
ncbi:hypothetical protein SAMN02745111_02470, partial [Eubacterium uniforme]